MRVQIVFLAFGLIFAVAGYPQERDLTATPQSATHTKTSYEDSEAAASETGGAEEAYDDGDDSDMYMEPDGAESTHTDAQHESPSAAHQAESYQPPHVTIVAVRPVQTSIHVTSSESSESAKSTSKSSEPEEKSLESDSQNFFPSFAEIFGNPRGVPFAADQRSYRPSRFLGYFRDRPYTVAASSKEGSSTTLLGSGNFGVIRGGTYYPEDKENDEYSIDESAYSPYYHGTGRGRPGYYKNPKPQPVRGGDIFANFRDFADITAPAKSSFSHLSIVYANKNGSAAGRAPEQPRNIIETLRMLEAEEDESGTTTTTTEVPQKKLSQNKRKLMKFKKYQEEKAKKMRIVVEPLLALS